MKHNQLAGILALVMLLGAALAASTPAVVGDWEGSLDTGSGTLRVVLHISQAKDGSLAGTLDSPDQGASGIEITSIRYDQPDLHFALESIGGSFDGKLSKDNSEIAGQWNQSGKTLPLVFKRLGK